EQEAKQQRAVVVEIQPTSNDQQHDQPEEDTKAGGDNEDAPAVESAGQAQVGPLDQVVVKAS
ncbi:MAG: hypothetical protein KDI56_13520, partial [Xanthomonadales bacterium]|nr:hypothetical protein [Xanthomonadales bacterium]